MLITDGYDEHSTSEFEEAVTAAQNSSVTVYVVGLGGVAGISLKGRSCSRSWPSRRVATRGFLETIASLSEAYAATAEDVQQRYMVTYTPANQRRDGTWRASRSRRTIPAARARPRRLHRADGAACPRLV